MLIVVGVLTSLTKLISQGDDANGKKLRKALSEHGIRDHFVTQSPNFVSPMCHVFLDEAGERSSLMSSAATSSMTDNTLARLYTSQLQDPNNPIACISSEVSQMPLSGVAFLLAQARQRQVPFALDVDVPVHVATGTAQLGTLSQLAAVSTCVGGPTIVKLSNSATESLLYLGAAVKSVLGVPAYDSVPHDEAAVLLDAMLETPQEAAAQDHRSDSTLHGLDAELLGPRTGNKVAQELQRALRSAERDGDITLKSSVEYRARQLVQALSVPMVMITDGVHGSAIAVGEAAKSDPAVSASFSEEALPGALQYTDVGNHFSLYGELYGGAFHASAGSRSQVNSAGAGDAFFGGALAAITTWGFPANAQHVARVAAVANAAGSACIELEGTMPDLTAVAPNGLPASLTRMLQLAPQEVLELLEDADAQQQTHLMPRRQDLEGGAPMRADPEVGRSRVLASISHGVHSSQTVRDVYAAEDSVHLQRLMAASESIAEASVKGRHVYCTGVGGSAALAQRCAGTLRSLGVPATFVHGAEWGQGDAGTLRAGDVLVMVSHTGNSSELVPVVPLALSKGASLAMITAAGGDKCALIDAAQGKLCVLHAPSTPDAKGNPSPFRTGVPQTLVINALATAVAHHMKAPFSSASRASVK